MAMQPVVQQRRLETEEAIIDAFERVLTRDGAQNLSPTAIMDEAGYGKPLLYKYFGGLPGLVRAWGERRRAWREPEALRRFTGSARTRADYRTFLKADLANLAGHLRGHPATLELLAEELTARSDLTESFAKIRRRMGQQEWQRIASGERPPAEQFDLRVPQILYSAVVYLAMRARTSPQFMDLDLSNPGDWDEVLATIDAMIERLVD